MTNPIDAPAEGRLRSLMAAVRDALDRLDGIEADIESTNGEQRTRAADAVFAARVALDLAMSKVER